MDCIFCGEEVTPEENCGDEEHACCEACADILDGEYEDLNGD